MFMNREDHAKVLQTIVESNGDLAALSAQAVILSEDYAGVLSTAATASEQIAALVKANSDLEKQNMEFFRKIAVVPTDVEETDENEKTYDKLFDDDGNLK